jgi:hypothetical protein
MAFTREERRTEYMPVLASTDEFTTPRSALRHRPIGEERPIVTTAPTPIVPRASRQRPRPADAGLEVEEWERAENDTSSTNSKQAQAHSTQTPIRRAGAFTGSRTLPRTPLPKAIGMNRIPKRYVHPLLYLGLGMLGMLALWTLLLGVASWFNTTMDDIHYGRPRTFQTDQFVGHNESAGIPSHFIAINFHGRIEVIEFPGGDATHARIFMGPQLYTNGSDLVPVTLNFLDVNGDHRPDMIIMFQGSQVVFINDQGTFRPLRPEERHQVEDFLQHHGP